LKTLEASLKWEVRLLCSIPVGVVLFFISKPAIFVYAVILVFSILVTDALFSVVVLSAFLRPIWAVLRHSNGGGGQARSRDSSLSHISRTKWTTLVGATAAVLSSSILYLNVMFAAVFTGTFVPSPWLNPFVFMINFDSIMNDFGLLLVSGILTSASFHSRSRIYNITSAKASSQHSAVTDNVNIARPQLKSLEEIPNLAEFTPPQQQPCCARLQLIAGVFQDELFSGASNSKNMRAVNDTVALIIDDDFVPAAEAFFARCVEQAPPFGEDMREQYHRVRKGHLAIYSDVLHQVRQEPTFPQLQGRSENLVADCKRLGRPQAQQCTTVSGLLKSGEAVSQRYNALMGSVATKTGTTFHKARAKGLVRILEKMPLTVGPTKGKPQRVCDFVRGAIECNNFTTMMSVKRLLCDLDSKLTITGEAGGITEEICISRSKGRFGTPTSGGWADIMINFYFKDDDDQHICELQLVHTQLYTVRKNMGAHATYSVFRAALELLEMLGMNPEDEGDVNELAPLMACGIRSRGTPGFKCGQLEGSHRSTDSRIRRVQSRDGSESRRTRRQERRCGSENAS
jgi:hypothetical protein